MVCLALLLHLKLLGLNDRLLPLHSLLELRWCFRLNHDHLGRLNATALGAQQQEVVCTEGFLTGATTGDYLKKNNFI